MSTHKDFYIAYNEKPQTQVGLTHDHTANEIIFVREGEANFIINNNNYTLKRNSIVFISSFEKHELISSSSTYKRFYLLVDDSYFIPSLFDLTLTSIFKYRPQTFYHVMELDDEMADKINYYFENMLDEYQTSEPYKFPRLISILCDTLILLYRFNPNMFYEFANSGYLSLIAKVQAYLNSNFKKNISLASTANLYHTNASYLSQKFKEIIGCSFTTYLINLRIAHAKYLLATTNIPIAQVAKDCGFNDQSHFMHKFKENTKVTPLTYRTQASQISSITHNSY